MSNFLGDLWGSFSGSTATKKLQEGQQQANALLQGGQQQATGNYNTGYQSALGRINPMLQSGTAANDLYANHLGVNGAPAQQNAMSSWQTSPGYQYMLNERMRGLNARANAGGAYYSGAALRGAGDAHQGMMSQEYQNYMNRLGGYAGQGAQMAQYGAGLDTQNANNLATLNYGAAQQQAGNAISMANAQAQQSGALWNNIMGLGSMAVSAYTGMPVGKKPGATPTGTGNAMGNYGWSPTNNNFSLDQSWQGYGMGGGR